MIIVIFENMRNYSVYWCFSLFLTYFSLGDCFAQQDLDEIRKLIFEKTNDLRLDMGLPKLKPLDSLMNLAQVHSENMVKYNFYAHVDHL